MHWTQTRTRIQAETTRKRDPGYASVWFVAPRALTLLRSVGWVGKKGRMREVGGGYRGRFRLVVFNRNPCGTPVAVNQEENPDRDESWATTE